MPDRTTTLTSAGFAMVIAGMALMSVGCAPARAAGDCLHGPNRATPGGSHWRYRLDRQDHLKCWYLADVANKGDRAVPSRPSRLAKRSSLPTAERMAPSIADAHAELPVLTYTETFIEGPRGNSPEQPVSRGGAVPLNSAPSGDSEPLTTSPVKGASTEVPPRVPPIAADLEAEEPLPTDYSAGASFRLTLSLLLAAAWLVVIGLAALVFRRSDPVSARLNGDSLDMHRVAGEPEQALEQITSEQAAALALARDIPLFLVRERIGAD